MPMPEQQMKTKWHWAEACPHKNARKCAAKRGADFSERHGDESPLEHKRDPLRGLGAG